MPSFKTVSISKLPKLRVDFISSDDVLPVVDSGTNTNKTVTLDDIAAFTYPVGSIATFLKTGSIPTYFLPCTGGYVNSGSYSDLLAVLPSTIKTGNEFRLPNLTHPDANLAYYICAGYPRPASLTPVLTAATFSSSLSSLTAIRGITTFNIPVTYTGGGGTVLYSKYLSAGVTVSSRVFHTPSTIVFAVPNGSNSGNFYGNNNPYSSVLFFSTTGTRGQTGIEATNVQSVVGDTTFHGINTLSALPLLSSNAEYIPHLPFMLQNNAAATSTYIANYLSQSYRGNVTASFIVPAFEYTVNGSRYTLKSFVINKARTIPVNSIYDPRDQSVIRTQYCDSFLAMYNPSNSATDLSLQPAVSSALGNVTMRNKLYSDGTSFSGSTAFGYGISLSALLGYAQKPFFLTNPVKINGEWGYLFDSSTSSNKTMLNTFANQGWKWPTNLTSSSLYPVISATNVLFNNTFIRAVSSLSYTYKSLNYASVETLTNTTTAIRDGIKYYNISIPLDNVVYKTIVSYYVKS